MCVHVCVFFGFCNLAPPPGHYPLTQPTVTVMINFFYFLLLILLQCQRETNLSKQEDEDFKRDFTFKVALNKVKACFSATTPASVLPKRGRYKLLTTETFTLEAFLRSSSTK